jgi:hypothetical protein
VQSRHDACRYDCPSRSRPLKPIEAQPVGEVDHVQRERGLLAGTKRAGTEAGRPETSKVRHNRAVALLHQPRHHLVVRAHIVRKPVQEHNREAGGVAAVFVPDRQVRGVDGARRRELLRLRKAACREGYR